MREQEVFPGKLYVFITPASVTHHLGYPGHTLDNPVAEITKRRWVNPLVG